MTDSSQEGKKEGGGSDRQADICKTGKESASYICGEKKGKRKRKKREGTPTTHASAAICRASSPARLSW